MCISYASRDRDVAIRLTCALLGAWTDNRDNLANLWGSVHPSVAWANLQLRKSLVCDTWYQSIVEKCQQENKMVMTRGGSDDRERIEGHNRKRRGGV